jgi:hypothetical protein
MRVRSVLESVSPRGMLPDEMYDAMVLYRERASDAVNSPAWHPVQWPEKNVLGHPEYVSVVHADEPASWPLLLPASRPPLVPASVPPPPPPPLHVPLPAGTQFMPTVPPAPSPIGWHSAPEGHA